MPEPNFLDQEEFGPFDGLLLVFNVGSNNYRNLPIQYREELRQAIAQAHADGYAVVYTFDNMTGISWAPDDFDSVNGMDFYHLASNACGVPDISFPYLPRAREEEARRLVENAFSLLQNLKFEGRHGSIIGQCLVGGNQVLIPLTLVS